MCILEKRIRDLIYIQERKAHADITIVASRPLRQRKRQVVEDDSDAEESLGDDDTDEDQESEEEVKPRKKPKVKAKRKSRKQSKRNRVR